MNPPLERQRELSFNPDARTKKTGYDSQVDVAEALALDLDATIIAGTGSGKTLAWALPLLLDENRDKFCVVISPLNELEADLARFFTEKLKIPAVAINHDTWNARDISIQTVREKLYRIIPISPEICLGNSGFAALLKDPRWSRSVLFMVVDEAHYIKQWGAEFRKNYTSPETLPSFLPRRVSVLATSATMPPDTLENVRLITGDNCRKIISSEPWER